MSQKHSQVGTDCISMLYATFWRESRGVVVTITDLMVATEVLSSCSHEEMRGYLRLLKRETHILGVEIDWDIIDTEKIEAFSPGKRRAWRVDAIAGETG